MKYAISYEYEWLSEYPTGYKDKFERKGYKTNDGRLYKREIKVPLYSSQIPSSSLKYVGGEPDNGSAFFIRTDRYYYAISRETYERMRIKPKLTDVYMPLRLHNYDGFVEVTQNGRKGIGWTETIRLHYHKSITKTYFVED